MNLRIQPSDPATLAPFRERFLHENDMQFVHDKCHRYNWADIYRFDIDDTTIGYGSVWGQHDRQVRDTFFEFYLLPEWRPLRAAVFQAFHQQVAFPYVECQTNDAFTSEMVFLFGEQLQPEAVLFKDVTATAFTLPGVHMESTETTPGHHYQYALYLNGETIATGGMLLNYNFPYADLYYDVPEPFRRKGYGAFLTQELKKAARALGRVPAARCNVRNLASRALLLKAGFEVGGFLLNGKIK